MYEVELKAWLDNREETEKIVAQFAQFEHTVVKQDSYWQDSAEPLHHRVRIRQEENLTVGTKQVLITYKEKHLEGNIEVNKETEFSVSDIAAFKTFLSGIGFVPDIEKHKTVASWKYQNAHIEIAQIKNLGDFIEIEILSETQDPVELARHKKSLYQILQKCGVPKEKIENRYYTQLLL